VLSPDRHRGRRPAPARRQEDLAQADRCIAAARCGRREGTRRSGRQQVSAHLTGAETDQRLSSNSRNLKKSGHVGR
jgi:hypothetical protein